MIPVVVLIASALGGAVAGGTVGVGVGWTYEKLKEMYDDKIEEARKEGFEHGLEKGANEVARKFMVQLQTNKKLEFGVWAILLYVAKLDGLSESEKEIIDSILGAPDTPIKSEEIRYEYKKIYEENLNFQMIKERYLDELNYELIIAIDNFIKEVMGADGPAVAVEKIDFYDYEWNPYVSIRRSEEYDKGR